MMECIANVAHIDDIVWRLISLVYFAFPTMLSIHFKHDPDFHYPSVARRLLCGLGYSFGVFAAISVVGTLFVSMDCQFDGKCSLKDRVVDTSLSGVWLFATIVFAYKAWRAELPGCRKLPRQVTLDGSNHS